MGLLAGGALLAFFAVVEDVVTRDPLVRVDDSVFHALQSMRTASLDGLIVSTTELGDWLVTTAVAVVAFLWLIWRRNLRAALYLGAAVLVSGVFSFLLKFTLRVARPINIDSGWDAFSFPSGHATVNATLYGFLTVLIARELRSWRCVSAVTVAVAFIFSIAFSRLYLGAHFLSDVMAGLCFSTAWVTLVSAVYLHRRPPMVGAEGLSGAVVITILFAGGWHIYQAYPADIQRYALRTETLIGPRTNRSQAWSNNRQAAGRNTRSARYA